MRQAGIASNAEALTKLNMRPVRHTVLVERHAHDGVCLQRLEPHAAAFTGALVDGATLGDVLKHASKFWPGFDPLATLTEHLARGRFGAVRAKAT